MFVIFLCGILLLCLPGSFQACNLASIIIKVLIYRTGTCPNMVPMHLRVIRLASAREKHALDIIDIRPEIIIFVDACKLRKYLSDF